MTMPTVNINRSAIAIPTAIHRLRLDHIVIAVEVSSVLEEASGACSDAVVGACSMTVTVRTGLDGFSNNALPDLLFQFGIGNGRSVTKVSHLLILFTSIVDHGFYLNKALFKRFFHL
jgi:hypothetical protein